ncbi:MAG: hypothetical protein GEU80_02350 [Dehalococcoidia bacterium]|nr:hypothetical protein [Dehalococcoidia bacterium]
MQEWEIEHIGDRTEYATLHWNGCSEWLYSLRDEDGDVGGTSRGDTSTGDEGCHIPGVWFRSIGSWLGPEPGQRQLGAFEHEFVFTRDCSEVSNPVAPDSPLGPDFCADASDTFVDRVVAAFDPDTQVPMRYSQYLDGVLVFEHRAVSLTLIDEPIDLTLPYADLLGRRIDTGFGWSYIVDAIDVARASTTVTYHVEGDVDGVHGLPAEPPAPAIHLPFPEDGLSATVMIDRPEDGAVLLAFGGATRWVGGDTVLRLSPSEASGWTSPYVETDATRIHNVSVLEEQPGFVSVRIESSASFTGSGSPGNVATLQDQTGRSYDLHHVSGSPGGGYSQWDFVGPLATDAEVLTLTIPGLLQVESGPWLLTVPLE